MMHKLQMREDRTQQVVAHMHILLVTYINTERIFCSRNVEGQHIELLF